MQNQLKLQLDLGSEVGVRELQVTVESGSHIGIELGR